jgi:DNA polymerase/3'-5' exonuclease PolX
MNENIIKQFELLIEQIKFDIDYTNGKKKLINTYRLESIKKALDVIKKYDKIITDAEQLKNYDNIGNGTLKRIDEILKNGKLSEIKISQKDKKHLEIFDELEKVFGIGRKKAYLLFSKYNIKSIDDLKEKIDNKTIVNLPDNILIGLKYYDKIQENIPRNIIEKITNVLKLILLKIDISLLGITCGSYRRLKETCNDIDFIIVHPKLQTKEHIKKHNINYLEKFVKYLKNENLILASLTDDNVTTKYMGILKDYIRIDIRFIPYVSFYSAILYFTGSRDFNKKMRFHAQNLGYLLNEYGLFKNTKMVKIKSEKDIFDKLSMEYITPDKR